MIQYSQLAEKFVKRFSDNPVYFFSSPGRTELGGNHTDHNGGCVLAASIDLDTVAYVSPAYDYTVTVFSDGFEPVCIDISDLNARKDEQGKSSSLIRGVAASIAKRGGYLGGFNAVVSSRVFPGSGLSSSASYEVLIGKIFSVLFNDDRFSSTEIAIMGREAENNYFNKPCGLMDQVACANGGAVGIDFKNSSSPVIVSAPADFRKWGYDLLIVNTPFNHADLTPEYAAIPGEMKMVASWFGKDLLAEVDPAEFEEKKDKIAREINCDRAVSRAHHFFTETIRAQHMLQALLKDDSNKYMNLVRESGNSSYHYLQKIGYLKEALDISNDFLEDRGFARVHGGGFAGTIQVYVSENLTSEYKSLMESKYGKGCVTAISIRKEGVTAQIL